MLYSTSSSGLASVLYKKVLKVWNFAYKLSDDSDLLSTFTFGLSSSLVHIRSPSSSQCFSAPESFASTEEGGKYKVWEACALDFQNTEGRRQLMWMIFPQLLLSTGRKAKFRTNMLTNFASSVDFAQSLCFILFGPPLEKLFKHGWLCSIIDHFNVDGWRIAFGLDKTLVDLKKDICGDTPSFLQTWRGMWTWSIPKSEHHSLNTVVWPMTGFTPGLAFRLQEVSKSSHT